MTQLFSRIGSISVQSKSTGSKAREYKGLRFSFTIEMSSEPNANTAKFSIFNMNEKGRSALEEEGSKVICRAGYAGAGISTKDDGFLYGKQKDEIIFIGEIQKNGLRIERSGSEIITHLECATALKATQETVINKSYAEGAKGLDVVKEIASSMGLNISQLPSVDLGVFLNGLSLSGNAKDMLTKVLNKTGLQWSVQDDELQITEKDKPTPEQAVSVTSTTGLIGLPTKRQDGSVLFTTLLNPKIKPSRAIILQTNTITGNFRARKVSHDGDLDSGPFDTIVEAVEIK